MPGRTGSGIAAGDRLAGAWGSRFCSARPQGCVGQNWGDHASLTRFALAHGTMGRLRESPLFLLRLTSGDQRCRPRPGKARGKRKPGRPRPVRPGGVGGGELTPRSGCAAGSR